MLTDEEMEFVRYEKAIEWARDEMMYREPVYEDGHLFVNDEGEAEEIERKVGCKLEEMGEGDLLDIVYERTGIVAESAKYDRSFDSIDYRYEIEEDD